MSTGLDQISQSLLDQSGEGGLRERIGVDAPETASGGYFPKKDISLDAIQSHFLFQQEHDPEVFGDSPEPSLEEQKDWIKDFKAHNLRLHKDRVRRVKTRKYSRDNTFKVQTIQGQLATLAQISRAYNADPDAWEEGTEKYRLDAWNKIRVKDGLKIKEEFPPPQKGDYLIYGKGRMGPIGIKQQGPVGFDTPGAPDRGVLGEVGPDEDEGWFSFLLDKPNPFSPKDINDSLFNAKVLSAVEDIHEALKVGREGHAADWHMLLLHTRGLVEEQRGQDTSKYIVDGAMAMSRFMGTFFSGGKFAKETVKQTAKLAGKNIGKAAVSKLVKKLIQRLADPKAGFLMKAGGAFVGGSGRFALGFPAFAPMTAKKALGAMIPASTLRELPDGDIAYLSEEVPKDYDAMLPYILEATGDTYIEIVSEHTGGALVKGAGNILKGGRMLLGRFGRWTHLDSGAIWTIDKLRKTKLATAYAAAKWRMFEFGESFKPAWNRVMAAAKSGGFDGVFAEMGEEDVGRIMRASSGIGYPKDMSLDDRLDSAWKDATDFEDRKKEAMLFSTLPIGTATLAAVGQGVSATSSAVRRSRQKKLEEQADKVRVHEEYEETIRRGTEEGEVVPRTRRYTPQQVVYGVVTTKDQDETMEVLSGVTWKGGIPYKADGTPLSRTEFAELTGGVATQESEEFVTESGEVTGPLRYKDYVRRYVKEVQRLREQREAREREEVSPTGTPREEREDPIGGAEFDKPEEEAEEAEEELSDEEYEKRLVEGTFGGGSIAYRLSDEPPDTPGITEEDDAEEGQIHRELRSASQTLGLEDNLFLVDSTAEEPVPGVYDKRTGNIYLSRVTLKRLRAAELKKEPKNRKDPVALMREAVERVVSHEWSHQLSKTDPKAWEEIRSVTLARPDAVRVMNQLVGGESTSGKPTEKESLEAEGYVIFRKYVASMEQGAEEGDPAAQAFMRKYNSLRNIARSSPTTEEAARRVVKAQQELADLIYEEGTAGWVEENLSKMGFWSKLAKKDVGLFRRASDFFRRLFYRISDAPAFRAIDNAIRRAEQGIPQKEAAKRKDKIEVPPLGERDVLFAAPRREAFTEEDMRTAQSTFRAGAFTNKRIVVDHVASKIAGWRRAGQPDVLNYGAGRADGLKHSGRLRQLGANVVSHDFPESMATWPEEDQPPKQDPMRNIRRKHDIVFASAVLNTIPSREGVEAAIAQIANATRSRGTAVVNYPTFGGKHPLSGVPREELEGMLRHYFGNVRRVNRDNASPMYEASQPKREALPAGPLFAARKSATEPRKLSNRFELTKVQSGTDLAKAWGEEGLYLIDRREKDPTTENLNPMEGEVGARSFWSDRRGGFHEFSIQGQRYVTYPFGEARQKQADEIEGVEVGDWIAPVIEIGGEEYAPDTLPRTTRYVEPSFALYSARPREESPLDEAFTPERIDRILLDILENREYEDRGRNRPLGIPRAMADSEYVASSGSVRTVGGFIGGFGVSADSTEAELTKVRQLFPGLGRDIDFFKHKRSRTESGFGKDATFIVISTGSQTDERGVAHHLLVQTSSLPFMQEEGTSENVYPESFRKLISHLRDRGIDPGTQLHGRRRGHQQRDLNPYYTTEHDNRPKLLHLGTHFVTRVDKYEDWSARPPRPAGVITRPFKQIGDHKMAATDLFGNTPFMRLGQMNVAYTDEEMEGSEGDSVLLHDVNWTDALGSDYGNTILDLIAMTQSGWKSNEWLVNAVGVHRDASQEERELAATVRQIRLDEGAPAIDVTTNVDVYEDYVVTNDRGYPVAHMGLNLVLDSLQDNHMLRGQVAGVFHRPGMGLVDAAIPRIPMDASTTNAEVEEIIVVVRKDVDSESNLRDNPEDFMSIRLVKVSGTFESTGDKVWLPTHVRMSMAPGVGPTVQRMRVSFNTPQGAVEVHAAGPMFVQNVEEPGSVGDNLGRVVKHHLQMEIDHMVMEGDWDVFADSVRDTVPGSNVIYRADDPAHVEDSFMRDEFWSVLTDQGLYTRRSQSQVESRISSLFGRAVPGTPLILDGNQATMREFRIKFPRLRGMNIVNPTLGQREVTLVLADTPTGESPGDFIVIGVRESSPFPGAITWNYSPVIPTAPFDIHMTWGNYATVRTLPQQIQLEAGEVDVDVRVLDYSQLESEAAHPLIASSSVSNVMQPVHFADVLQAVEDQLDALVVPVAPVVVIGTAEAEESGGTEGHDIMEVPVTLWRHLTDASELDKYGFDEPVIPEDIIKDILSTVPDPDNISSDEFWSLLKTHDAVPSRFKHSNNMMVYDYEDPQTDELKIAKVILDKYFEIRWREIGIEDNEYIKNAMRRPSSLGNLKHGEPAPREHQEFLAHFLSSDIVTSWEVELWSAEDGSYEREVVGSSNLVNAEGSFPTIPNGAKIKLVLFGGGISLSLDSKASIYLASIRSDVSAAVSGNDVMVALNEAADKTGTVITGYPSSFGQMPQSKLVRWYATHGYEPVFLHQVADFVWAGKQGADFKWYGWRHPRDVGWELQPRGSWGIEGRKAPPMLRRKRNPSYPLTSSKRMIDETSVEFKARLDAEGITPYYAAQNRTLNDIKISLPEAQRLFQTAGYKSGRSMARTKDRLNFMQLDPDHVGPAASILGDRVGVDQVNKDLQRMWDDVLDEMPEWQGKDGRTQFKEADGLLKDEYKFQLPNGWNKKFPTAGDFLIGSVAMRDEFRYWYERYVTASRKYLDLTDHEWDVFNKVLAATSQRTNVKDNMERTLSIMSEIFGNRFGSTDVISDQSIRNALEGQLGTEDQLKTGSFNTTFEFLAGRGSDIPLSTNDAIMATVFGLPGNAFADSFWYESVSRYMIKMSGYLNSTQGSEHEPYQSWQLQALMWVNRDDDRATQTYVQTLESFIERAIEAGVMKPGERLTPSRLADPEMSDIARSGKISHFNRTPRGLYTLAGSVARPVQRANLVRDLLRWAAEQAAVPERVRQAMSNKISKGYDAIWRGFSRAISRKQPYKRPLGSGVRKGGDILTELFSSISGLKAGYTAVLSDPEVTRASRVTPATTGGAIFSEDAHSTMTVPFWNVDDQTRKMVNALIGRASGAGGVESLQMEVTDEDTGLALDRDEIGYTTSSLFIQNLSLSENDTRWVGNWIRENIDPGFRLVTEVNWSGTQLVVLAPKMAMMEATPERQPTVGISQTDLVEAVHKTIAVREQWSDEEFADRVTPTLMHVVFNKSSDQLSDKDYDRVIDNGLERLLDEDTRNNGEQLFRGIKGYSGTSKAAEPIRLIVKDAAKRKRAGYARLREFEHHLRQLIQRPEQLLSEVDWDDIQKRTGTEEGIEGRVREALGRYSRFIRTVDAISKLGSAAGSFQSRLDQFSQSSVALLERTEKALNKAGEEFDYRSRADNNMDERVARIPEGVLFAASRRRSEDLANPATDPGARDLVDSIDRQSRELLDLAGLREWRNLNRDEVHTQKMVEDEGEERLRKNGINKERDLLIAKMDIGRMFTDVDTYVAKKLINHFGIASIQSGNVDELRKTISLIEGYRDQGTEMARSFRQRFDPIETPRQRRKRLMTEGLLRPSVRLQKKIAKAKKDKDKDLLKALRDAIADENLDLFNHLTSMGYDLDKIDEYALNPRSAFEIIRIAQTFKASWGDKAYEWYINALLSGLSTQVANVIGTVPLSIWEYGIKRPLEAIISTPVRKGERVTLREIKHMWGAFWPSMKKAARVAMLAHSTEVPQLEVMLGRGVQGLQKYEIPRVSIKGRKGRFIRAGFTGLTGTRMLLAVDEFMKTVISGMEVAALAQREMVSKDVWRKTHEAALASGNSKSKSKDMADHATSTAMAELIEDTMGLKSDVWDRAMDMAHLLTFQTELGPIGKKALALRDATFVFKYVVPFAKTLMNITKLGLFPESHYSALGFVKMPKEIWNLYVKIDPKSKTGLRFIKPEDRDWSKVSSRALGQAGNFVAFMALYALLDGDDEERPWVTGSRSVWEYRSRLTGMREGTPPPMSFAWPVLRDGKIEKGPYMSFANVEPVSTIFGFGVDVINAFKSGDPARIVKEIPMSLSAQVFEKNLTRGVSDFLRIFEEPDYYGPKYLAHFVTGWIPGVYKRVARADRDYMPERRVYGDGTDWLKMLGQRTIERTELSRHIFPDLIIEHPAWGIWGRKIPSDINPIMQSKGMNWLYRATMPFHTQYADEFPMDVVIRKWNDEQNSLRDQVHFYPIRPEWKDKNGVKHYMTPEQLDQMGELAGKIAREVAKMEMPVIDWSKPTSQQDADAVKSVVNDSRTLAKDTLTAVWEGQATESDSFANLAEALHYKHITAQATILARPRPSKKSLGKWKKKEVRDREIEEWLENKKIAASWLRNRGMKRKGIMKVFPRTKGLAARLRLSRSLSEHGFKAVRETGVPAAAALR